MRGYCLKHFPLIIKNNGMEGNMRELILITSYWIHIVATVIWLGGITFILFVAIPSAKQVLGGDAGKLMGEITKRFTPLANYSIVLMVITGAVLMSLNKGFSAPNIVNYWTMTLILKLLLVIVMIAIHFYRGLVLAPKITRTATDSEKVALQRLSLNLVKVNLVLGLLVLLLSGAIHVL